MRDPLKGKFRVSRRKILWLLPDGQQPQQAGWTHSSFTARPSDSSSADQSQQNGDNGNDKQNVDDTSNTENKRPQQPSDDQNNGNDVQKIAHS